MFSEYISKLYDLYFTYCDKANTIFIGEFNAGVIKTEYYVSMLIRRFVSLRVACVKSYHARPKVERDATLHRQREVIQTDGSIC